MTDLALLVLDADSKGLRDGARDLDGLSRKSGDTAQSVDRSSGRMARAFRTVATTAAAAFSFNQLIQVNAEFGASMQRVAAISGATGAEFDELRNKALEMGRTTQFSAAQAADALGFLAMAGFSASEAVASLPAVLDLAASSGMDLGQSADIASNVLSGFGLAADEAAQVADVLAAASSRTNTNVTQLGGAMSTVAPIASAMGISLQETAAAIGVMSDAGIQGERAGTALRGVLASLAGPTTQAQEALARYGLTAADVDPQVAGLTGAMARLSDAGLSTADAMTIFGREAASGALVLADTTQRAASLTEQFNEAEGSASRMAATMRDNLQGDLQGLRSAFEALIISVGDGGATGALRTLAQSGAEALRALSSAMDALIAIVGGATAAWAAYQGSVLAASVASTTTGRQLALMGGVVASVTRQVGLLAGAKVALSGAMAGATAAARTLTAALVANPFGAVALAVGVLTTAMIGLGNAQRQARAETDNLVRSLRALAQARSADFAQQRNEAQIALSRNRDEVSRLENEIVRRRRARGVARNPEIETARIRSLEGELRDARWAGLELRTEISLADRDFRRAGEAAEQMAVPVAQSATAMSQLSGSAGQVSSSVSAANDNIDQFSSAAQNLIDRLFPLETTLRTHHEELRTLEMAHRRGTITLDQYTESVTRLRRELAGVDVTGRVGEPAIAGLNLGDFEPSFEGLEDLEQSVELRTGLISEHFATMAAHVASSLQQFTSLFGSSGLSKILSGVLGLFSSFAGTGLFGTNLQKAFSGFSGVFGGFRAEGGPVTAGQSYIVGERGPELFTPGVSGGITANDNMSGGSMKIEVVPSPYFDVKVNGQIMETAPAIAQSGAALAQTQMAANSRYRVR